MIQESDFVRFKHESYRLKLKQLAKKQGRDPFQDVYVFFGGTGAVGGQGVIELLQGYEFMALNQATKPTTHPVIAITGISENEVSNYVNKLYGVFGKYKFEEETSSGDSVRILKHVSGVSLNFYLLMAKPTFQNDVAALVAETSGKEEAIELLKSECSKMSSPFSDFLERLKNDLEMDASKKFRAVLSGIPIPSVATYHFEEIDRILDNKGISAVDEDKSIERSIKIEILKGLAEDFGNIKNTLAEEVLIAHTTSVGGMYQIVDGKPVIKLGYAHSSLGELLKEKQFYANQLTIQYSRLGLKSLITASAIGIDYIYTGSQLPLSSGVSRKYRIAAEKGELPFDIDLLKTNKGPYLVNKVFQAKNIQPFHPVKDADGNPMSESGFNFADSDKLSSLKVNYALRSGENGVFSLDNAYALYLNMKIASQEELAHVLIYNALFGDDQQKSWFDQDGLCYYTQTDNSSLIFALLNNRHEFRKDQTSAFSPKAFQELGSSKHQGELHTIGLYMLLHKLKSLKGASISRDITSKYKEAEVMEYVDRNAPKLLLEDVVKNAGNIDSLSADFSELLELDSPEMLARFTGYQGELSGFVKTFFVHLFSLVKQTINTITSLGSPILYTDAKGVDRILSGPYMAPADLLIQSNFSLVNFIKEQCEMYNLKTENYFEYLVCNQGFVDLRPAATLCTAKSHKDGLFDSIHRFDGIDDFREAIVKLQQRNDRSADADQHFTTSGLVAFSARIIGLKEKLDKFKLSLGSNNGWKALFPVDHNGNHPLVPGLVEAMRMYGEGLGKITGTEFLYPGYGYFDQF
jgi:hypothetical protein